MSKSFTTIREKLDEIIGEKNFISLTTSAAGATDKTTAVDASLARYKDNYFKNWYLHLTVAGEERKVKTFLSPSGTLTIWEAFSAQVATSKGYSLSKFSIDEKKVAINRALADSYSYFYNRLSGVLIGLHTSDKDDREYLLSTIIGDTFTEIPQQIYVHDCYYGDHTGDDDASTLTDSSKSWDTDELVGHVVYNKTDGSYGTITANTATTVTATLANGTGDDWDEDDEYIIPKNLMPERSLSYQTLTGDNTKFYADVTDKKLILCIGQAQLTPFTKYTGTHDGAANASVLTDSGESWTTDMFKGAVVYNITDGSYGTVTANTATTITATLANGTDDDWDVDDTFHVTNVTELDTDEQAEIVALKAAANLYKMAVATVDSSDASKYKEQAYQWEMEYLYRIKRRFMAPLTNKIGIRWPE